MLSIEPMRGGGLLAIPSDCARFKELPLNATIKPNKYIQISTVFESALTSSSIMISDPTTSNTDASTQLVDCCQQTTTNTDPHTINAGGGK